MNKISVASFMGSIVLFLSVIVGDWWTWNALFNSNGIGQYIGFTILAVLSIIWTIMGIAFAVVLFIIGVTD